MKPKPACGQENDVELILRKQCWLHKFPYELYVWQQRGTMCLWRKL